MLLICLFMILCILIQQIVFRCTEYIITYSTITISQIQMGKKVTEQAQQTPLPKQKHAKNSKYNRFQQPQKVDPKNKSTWPTDAVVYIGHIPHGFYQQQLTSYFKQYGEVLAVKVARSRKTARSKGYAFIQYKYPQVAAIVAETMNGYMLMGKILVANTLNGNKKNPFAYASSKQFKFIDWKRLFIKQKNRNKTEEETKKQVQGLIKNQQNKRQKLKQLGIQYDYPGFEALVKK